MVNDDANLHAAFAVANAGMHEVKELVDELKSTSPKKTLESFFSLVE
jgi:hypothetical protein